MLNSHLDVTGTMTTAIVTVTDAVEGPRKPRALEMEVSIPAAHTITRIATPRTDTTAAVARRTRTSAHSGERRKVLASAREVHINVDLTIMAPANRTLDTGAAKIERRIAVKTHAKVAKPSTISVPGRLIINIISSIGIVDPTSITTATQKMANIAAKTFINKMMLW